MRQCFEGQMRLEEAAAHLALGQAQHDTRRGHPEVGPGRNVLHRERRSTTEHHHAHDPLRPSSAAFGVGRDKDVIRPHWKSVPERTVEGSIAHVASCWPDQARRGDRCEIRLIRLCIRHPF